MSYSKRIRTIFILIILLSHTLFAKELKKVTLQLSWLDQFQFAGYYMAKQKGFYEEVRKMLSRLIFQYHIVSSISELFTEAG